MYSKCDTNACKYTIKVYLYESRDLNGECYCPFSYFRIHWKYYNVYIVHAARLLYAPICQCSAAQYNIL